MSARSRQGYKNALSLLAARTGTPLPSLIVSFAILHEITAIVPLAGLFFGAKCLGVGERLVESIRAKTHTDTTPPDQSLTIEWVQRVGTWIDEGEAWTEKVGRRYGLFGYPKTPKGAKFEPTEGERRPGVAGDVANAVFAYTATKALVPVRLGVSFYLSPAFSRRVIEPIRQGFMFVLRRGRA
ncbi:hypothetical protein BDM02DRAFT_3092164 [Thelephora ganbajun]|uniref:Uncharacterized protein n=1 Tax=Thelephora ganbajun TaxID=370292 RepID=A0ACB6ZN06_THEGA|nr:hypothetical protein BDM02DRAFT_3092164 [Thelephora ganbajun]